MNGQARVSMAINRTLVLILAGGKGTRLGPLTCDRAKPAVEFSGHHRIIDFVLSNCVNSGLTHIAIVTQYQSQCLIGHLMQHWGMITALPNGKLDILPAFSTSETTGYTGTADACFKNLDYIKRAAPRFVLILSGDQVYQMDYRQMLTTHLEHASKATMSCINVPCEMAAGRLGVVSTDAHDEAIGFHEKPELPLELADSPGQCLISMGIYLFDGDFLCEILDEDAKDAHSAHDFGQNILPRLVARREIAVHRFCGTDSQVLPYWRDVGTLDSYWQCHMDLLRSPELLPMNNPAWPLYGQDASAQMTAFAKSQQENCVMSLVQVAGGCQLEASQISQSVLFPRCQIQANCVIDHAVLMSDTVVEQGVRLSHVIVENGCRIPANAVITDPDWARERGFTVTTQGIILITQNALRRCSPSTAGKAFQ